MVLQSSLGLHARFSYYSHLHDTRYYVRISFLRLSVLTIVGGRNPFEGIPRSLSSDNQLVPKKVNCVNLRTSNACYRV